MYTTVSMSNLVILHDHSPRTNNATEPAAVHLLPKDDPFRARNSSPHWEES
jgi:hypothetical protein